MIEGASAPLKKFGFFFPVANMNGCDLIPCLPVLIDKFILFQLYQLINRMWSNKNF